MFRHAGDHIRQAPFQPLRPVLSDQVVIAADAAGGDDHGLRAQREIAVTLRELLLPRSTGSGARIEPVTPSTVPPVSSERIDAVAEFEGQPAVRLASRARRSNGSTIPGPVPQVT